MKLTLSKRQYSQRNRNSRAIVVCKTTLTRRDVCTCGKCTRSRKEELKGVDDLVVFMDCSIFMLWDFSILMDCSRFML
ncbi:hypothetical protein ACS0TY_026637 [Phlomoides rotata]